MTELGDQELVTRILEGFSNDNEALIAQLLDLQYYFRGSLSRDDVWAMTPVEREKAVEFLNKRFKEIGDIAKKTGQLPSY